MFWLTLLTCGYNVWIWRLSLALCWSRRAYRLTLIFFSGAGIGILSLVKAFFAMDIWTSLSHLVPDNDQFWDLADQCPVVLGVLRADLVMRSAPSCWRSGSFPSQGLRHSRLKRSGPGDIGVARCAMARGLFELARVADRLSMAFTALGQAI